MLRESCLYYAAGEKHRLAFQLIALAAGSPLVLSAPARHKARRACTALASLIEAHDTIELDVP